MSKTISSQEKKQKASGDWIIFSARIRREKLNTLNYKLDQEGFKTVGEFINAWIDGNWPKHTNNEQVAKLIQRLREKEITDPLTGEVSPTFYKGIDREDMLRGYLKKYKTPKHARDLVRYYERFVDIFFSKPELITSETGHNRAWICDAMRKFGAYYDRKYNNPELRILIEEIIKRYELNKNVRIHDRVWIADEGFIETMIRKVLEIEGDLGTIIRFAFFSGLRGEEMTYAHETPICDILSGCDCDKLHLVAKGNYVILVLNRIVGQKHAYFTILPLKVWNDYKALVKVGKEERNVTHLMIKNHTDNKVLLKDLRKFHYNILCRSEMGDRGAEVLAGRAKSISAKHYLIHELDKLTEQYGKAVSKFVPTESVIS